MSFFKYFPRINYNVDGIHSNYVVNITTAFLLKRNNVDDIFLFQRYIIRDGDLPESVSEKLYKTPKYYWTILFINNIIDPMTEWYMDSATLEKFVEVKYPDGLYGIHHFYDTAIDRICDDVDDARLRLLIGTPNFPSEIIPVTNYQYELELNEKRREISVINPKAITRFVDEYQRILESVER
jgi:hypothetical protein